MTTITLPSPAIARQLRHATNRWRAYRNRPRTARVTGIYCPACHTWQPPRHFRPTAAACRTCTG